MVVDATRPVDFACGGEPLRPPDGALLCKDEGFRPLVPQRLPTVFTALHTFSANDAWAVGDGAAMHWDGKSWTTAKSPVTILGGGVWGRDPSDVWLGGRYSGDGTFVHWTGQTFEAVSTGLVGDLGRGSGLRGHRDVVWAVGELSNAVGQSFALSHRCGAWRRMPAPAGHAANDLLVFGEDDVWVTATVEENGPIRAPWHWDGNSWRAVDVEVENPGARIPYLLALGASGPGDIWAVGEEIELGDKIPGYVYRGDVNGLRRVHKFQPEPWLGAIWVESQNNVWVAGGQGRIEHWDGKAWTRQVTGSTASVYALDSYWAVGEGILRRQGDRWEEVLPRPGPGFFAAGYSASPSDAWLVGSRDTRRWDGRAWTPVPSLAGEHLATVWGRGSGEVWMGGEKLFRWDGKQTREVVDPVFSKAKVVGIWGPPRGPDVWFLTWSPKRVVVRWDGVQFREEPVPAPQEMELVALTGTDAEHVWVAGRNQTDAAIFSRMNGQWQTMYTRPKGDFSDLLAFAPSDLWVASGSRPLLHWDGANWKEAGRTGRRLWGKSPRSIWAVESGGPDGIASEWLWHGDGVRWNCVTGGRRAWAIFGTGDNDLWLANGFGADATILHKGP